jgi:ferredoxin
MSAEDDVPDSQREFTALNAELAKLWPVLIERKPAPADADEWAKVKEKKQLIER